MTCGQTTMAVRMPSHPVARALIEAAGVPLAAPSANSSGRPSPTSASHVMKDLVRKAAASGSEPLQGYLQRPTGQSATASSCQEEASRSWDVAPAPPPVSALGSSSDNAASADGGRVAMVVDGGHCACGVESTVLDGLRAPPAVLRPGGVTFEQLRELEGLQGLQASIDVCLHPGWPFVLEATPTDDFLHQVYQKHFQDQALEQAPTTPGMKYRHYSPDAPVILIDPVGWGCRVGCESDGPDGSDDGSLLAEAVHRSALSEVRQQQTVASGAVRRRVALLRTTMAPTGVAIGSAPIDGSSAFEGGGGSSSSSDDMIELALGYWGDSESVARRLFSALRRADELQVAAIVVEGVAESGAGMAVMNRLRKAASRIVTISFSEREGIVDSR